MGQWVSAERRFSVSVKVSALRLQPWLLKSTTRVSFDLCEAVPIKRSKSSYFNLIFFRFRKSQHLHVLCFRSAWWHTSELVAAPGCLGQHVTDLSPPGPDCQPCHRLASKEAAAPPAASQRLVPLAFRPERIACRLCALSSSISMQLQSTFLFFLLLRLGATAAEKPGRWCWRSGGQAFNQGIMWSV